MNSQISKSSVDKASSAFNLYSPEVQKWIWAKGWSSLHIIQERAALPIIEARSDVIISAPTAGGKTEAAFFPIISSISNNHKTKGFQVLCISPLKALINDQTERLESLCEQAKVLLTPWHGDVAESKKHRALKSPQGILMITPEFMEAMFVKRAPELIRLFQPLKYIVIDEFHAFIGTERGIQLLSLLHRLEVVLQRTIPRIAMSATLGDMQMVASMLKGQRSLETILIVDKAQKANIQVQVRGYLDSEIPDNDGVLPDIGIEDHLFKILRGSSNLVFAGSRQRVEQVSDYLREKCDKENVPNEFFPHHGNLSRSNRESLEHRLRDGNLPTTAVATTTLELGIDIGSVKSVAQIGAPRSIAGLRQRIGRSGRRKGSPSILRIYIEEIPIISKDVLPDMLRHNLVMAVAAIRLLIKGWYEPPNIKKLHLSTLIHQILSTSIQYGGISAGQLYNHLCKEGVFSNVDKAIFSQLLIQLGSNSAKLLEQSQNGTIFLGEVGEKIVNRYDFFAVFQTPEEYRVETNGQTLGSVPLQLSMQPGQYMIFSGRRWKIEDIYRDSKTISVSPAQGGRPPKFDGVYAENISDELVEEMLSVYCSDEKPEYCNEMALNFLNQGRESFNQAGLRSNLLIKDHDKTYIFPWVGSLALNTLCYWLQYRGFKAHILSSILIEIEDDSDRVILALKDLASQQAPDPVKLLNGKADKIPKEKFSEYLSDELLISEYAKGSLNTAVLPSIAKKILISLNGNSDT